MTDIKDGLTKIEQAIKHAQSVWGMDDDSQPEKSAHKDLEEALEICKALRQQIPLFPQDLLNELASPSPGMGGWGYSRSDLNKLIINQLRLNDFIGGHDEDS